MTLEWVGAPGNLVAVGTKGIYTIQTVRAKFILYAHDHDGLPMLALPFLGREFPNLAQAQICAARIDRAPAEAEISGA
jgi:hypothetical protein